MDIYVGYIYTRADGSICPGLEIVRDLSNTCLVNKCWYFLQSGEPIPHNDPEFAELVEDVPLGMRKDGVYIMDIVYT